MAGNDGAIFQITRLNITHKISGYHGQLLNKCSLYNTYFFSLKSLHLKNIHIFFGHKKNPGSFTCYRNSAVLSTTPLTLVYFYCQRFSYNKEETYKNVLFLEYLLTK